MKVFFVFRLYFSSTFNYVQLNYKFLACIEQSLLASKMVAPCVSSRTHPKKVVHGQEKKKLVRSCKGPPKRTCVQEKNAGRVQKNGKIMIVGVPEMKN